jgi:hypothetical protein
MPTRREDCEGAKRCLLWSALQPIIGFLGFLIKHGKPCFDRRLLLYEFQFKTQASHD